MQVWKYHTLGTSNCGLIQQGLLPWRKREVWGNCPPKICNECILWYHDISWRWLCLLSFMLLLSLCSYVVYYCCYRLLSYLICWFLYSCYMFLTMRCVILQVLHHAPATCSLIPLTNWLATLIKYYIWDNPKNRRIGGLTVTRIFFIKYDHWNICILNVYILITCFLSIDQLINGSIDP
jgi:hypothetical protein